MSHMGLTPSFILNKISRRLFAANLPSATAREDKLIRRLRERLRSLPGLESTEVESEAERIWLDFRLQLRAALLSHDPRRFLEFDVIRQTMFVDHPPYLKYEYDYLRKLPNWRTRWRSAIEESDRVIVPRYPYYPRTSGNLIHYAFHLAQFEAATGVDLSKIESVLEFGGGYGGMCRLLRRLGHSGPYTIFDLPEFSALQEFYLSLHDLGDGGGKTPEGAAVNCAESGHDFSELSARRPVDLFIATWSISETSLKFRESFLSAIDARNILIGYQGTFGEIDNADFFQRWSRGKRQWEWEETRSEHMPGNQYYLFGSRRGDTEN